MIGQSLRHVLAKKIYEVGRGSLLTLLGLAMVIAAVIFLGIRPRRLLSCSSLRPGAELIIVGNGPSASSSLCQLQERLPRLDLMVVNFFCLTPMWRKLKPSYSVLIDNHLFLNNSSVGPLSQKVQALISAYAEVDWCHTLYIPHRFQDSALARHLSLNPRVTIKHLNLLSVPTMPSRFLVRLFEWQLAMPVAESVSVAAIYAGLDTGCGRIFLIGMEHSWLAGLRVDKDNGISVDLPHFYGGSAETGEKGPLHKFLYSQGRLFEAHASLAAFANYCSVEIFNTCPESYIDAYDKQSFVAHDALASARPNRHP